MSIDNIGSSRVGFKGCQAEAKEKMSPLQERLEEVQNKISSIVGREAHHSMSRCGGEHMSPDELQAGLKRTQCGLEEALHKGEGGGGEDDGIAQQLKDIRQSQMLLSAMGGGGGGGFGGLGDFGGMGSMGGSGINPLMMQMLRSGNMESVEMMMGGGMGGMGGLGSLGGEDDLMSLLGGGEGGEGMSDEVAQQMKDIRQSQLLLKMQGGGGGF